MVLPVTPAISHLITSSTLRCRRERPTYPIPVTQHFFACAEKGSSPAVKRVSADHVDRTGLEYCEHHRGEPLPITNEADIEKRRCAARRVAPALSLIHFVFSGQD